jgi:hypothetical protein
MERKMLKTVTIVALLAVPVISQAGITTSTTFGTIPGTPNGGNPYSGHGIPYNASEITTISGITVVPALQGDPTSDTLTLALSATAHGSGNPAPGNDGAGDFTVSTGSNGNPSRSLWNFDFWISSVDGNLSPYTFKLTETANGQTYSFDPTDPAVIPDNVGGPGGAGNSESLDFAAFGPPIDYNTNQIDTYNFTLTAYQGGTAIGSDSITVNSVPEPTTIVAGALMLLPLGIGALRTLRNRQTRSEALPSVD